jgi:hypothetical protein
VRGPDRQAGLIQGEVCTCPSRALVPGGIDDDIAAQGVKRAEQVRTGHPLDTDTMTGAQASNASELGSELAGGYDVQPTVFEGLNSTRILQEEIFGPRPVGHAFLRHADAVAIANDTPYGLGAGVRSRDANTADRAGRDIGAGRLRVNNDHAYPAHAACGGYKQSGIGRENHKMMLDHHQQTKKHAGELLAERARGGGPGEADRLPHVRLAVRVLEAHAPHGRRRRRPWERVLGGGAGGALPHPLPAAHRRRGARPGRQLALARPDGVRRGAPPLRATQRGRPSHVRARPRTFETVHPRR